MRPSSRPVPEPRASRRRPGAGALPFLAPFLAAVALAAVVACSPAPPGSAPSSDSAAASPAASGSATPSTPATAATPAAEGTGVRPGAPGLVVLVVVDQLSAELVERYDELWSAGFRRLLDQGMVFTGASHAHAFTETAPGHATLATGVVPARHGVVANNWREPAGDGEWRSVYSVEDPGAGIVGSPSEAGRSPSNLLRPGLADWVRAANPGARVVSISRKDRSAVAMGGRVEDAHVYWLSASLGRFVTSAWYRDGYPGWVARVNRDVLPDLFGDTVWESTVPADARGLTRADDPDAEGREGGSRLPRRARAELSDVSPASLLSWVLATPAPDEAVLALALEALEALDLGGRPGPDFLAVGFSQADYIGHRHGPWSLEQLDNLLRLDRGLGRLLEALDRRVGEGRWVLALSADHGVLPYPEALRRRGEWGMRLDRGEVRALYEAVGEAAEARSPSDVPDAVARAAEGFEFVARAYTHREILADPPADTFIPLYRNALREDRRAGAASTLGVELRFRSGVLTGYPVRGTGHGSPYWYDRHVPLVLLGAGVAAGRSDHPAYTYDAAPTLAELGGIPIPSDLDGRSLIPPPDGG